jgi:hypothetical protein
VFSIIAYAKDIVKKEIRENKRFSDFYDVSGKYPFRRTDTDRKSAFPDIFHQRRDIVA